MSSYPTDVAEFEENVPPCTYPNLNTMTQVRLAFSLGLERVRRADGRRGSGGLQIAKNQALPRLFRRGISGQVDCLRYASFSVCSLAASLVDDDSGL